MVSWIELLCKGGQCWFQNAKVIKWKSEWVEQDTFLLVIGQ